MAMTNESSNGAAGSGGGSIVVGEEGRVLAAGVDSLYMTSDIFWRDDNFFKTLSALKAEAAEKRCEMPSLLKGEGFEWAFRVMGYGGDGYEWFLTSAEYEVKIGNWMSPQSRPSIMIQIHSETLWLYGVVEAIDRILTLLSCAGAMVKETKASRIDMCVDILLPASLWNPELGSHRVTRARSFSNHDKSFECSGFSIGQGGAFSARLYDKPMEIRQKSKKTWMFDVWQLSEVPEDCRIIRVEFQLRRDAITQLGMNSIWSFTNHPRNAWAYCSHCWLKFQDRPDLHHTQQTTMPFWKSVQDGFWGSQGEQPMLRAKMVNVKRKQIAQQLMGQLTSLIALDSEEFAPELELEQQLPLVAKSAALIGMDDGVLSEKVRRKQGQYLKAVEKFKNTEAQRKKLGLPQRMPREGGAA
jgi:hypothetical protein